MKEDWKYTDASKFKVDKIIKGKQKIEFSDKVLPLQKSPYKPMSLIKNKDEFLLLHEKNIKDGVFILIPKKAELTLTNKFISQLGHIFNHTIILLEENSSLNYIEEHYSKNNAHRSDVVEVYAKQNSRLNFYSFQNWKHDVKSIANWTAKLDKDSSVNWVFGQFGGKISRVKIDTIFNGHGARSQNYGVFFGNKEQHFDITTNAIHKTENTTSNILVKGVLDDKSTSVYRGKIKINEKAQQTNSYLSDHSLILSEKAISNSVPSLEIDANDVKASHGATLGKPNEDEIFYLMTRGLKRKEAERLIIKGYFSPVIDKLDKNLKIKFNQALTAKIR